jgi:hypothetical protein
VYFIVLEMNSFTSEQLDYLYDHGVPISKFQSYRFETHISDREAISVVDESVDSKTAGE